MYARSSGSWKSNFVILDKAVDVRAIAGEIVAFEHAVYAAAKNEMRPAGTLTVRAASVS